MQVQVSSEIGTLLDAGVRISVRRNQFFVGVEHLYDAIMDASSLLPKPFLGRYENALRQVSRELGREAWKATMPSGTGETFYTPRCARVLNDAARLADRYGNGPAGAGHLLLTLLGDAHAGPSRAMDRLGLPRGEMIAALRAALAGMRRPIEGKAVESATPLPSAAMPAASAEVTPSPAFSLDTITRDLTQAAREHTIMPAIARAAELFEILQVLMRKNKNNVMLVGEAGVGKTQLAEGLAVAVARDGLGGVLTGWCILELNLGALLAGTQYRGAFEEKMLALLDELKRAQHTIVFIDEVHLIMGAGATDGDTIDAANLLKPALARGEIRCIGATTVREYRRFIEKDPSIERRFQMVRVEPLTESATLEVLETLRTSFERHHGVHISSKAINAAVTLTQRYMPNRHLPDKAIDVLDQACARYRLKAIASRDRAGPPDGEAAPVRGNKVTPHDIRKVITQITAVPIEEITAGERLLLTDLERTLKKRITGQDEAVSKVVAAVKKARVGLGDPDRPEAILLFLGPTGVGKTHLATLLADVLFGSANHLVTFDMSEYTEAHSVSRLLGAPPGYVGSDEEGRLVTAVRNTPFSILLFDEIEKAHPRIFDLFLPIFDRGRLKDSRGRDVCFRNCIIILTSNIGADRLRHAQTADDLRRLVEELCRHFRPEFVNRIDEIVPFYTLLLEDIRTILQMFIKQIDSRLTQQGMRIHVYQRAYEYLAQQGYNTAFGARELCRTVDRLVTGPIGDRILRGEFQSGDTIEVLMENGELTFRPSGSCANEGGTGP